MRLHGGFGPDREVVVDVSELETELEGSVAGSVSVALGSVVDVPEEEVGVGDSQDSELEGVEVDVHVFGRGAATVPFTMNKVTMMIVKAERCMF